MHFSRLSLLWRVFAINATLLVAAAMLLLLTPVTVRAPIALIDGLELLVGLAVMLTANFLLLRHTIRPIDRLVQRMGTVDLLRPGQRLSEGGAVEAAALVRAFNQMLERLEVERRESGRRAVRAQEAERLRIARGLHDEVGQALTGVLLQLNSLQETDRGRRRDIEATRETVRRTLEEVRRIGRELRPEMLEQLGLQSALTELSRRFSEQSGIRVQRRFAEQLPSLSADAELAVYRVTQEGLTNVARHAAASRIDLVLGPGAGSVVLRVIDDGQGMGDATDSHATAGLRGMRERALLVGGALAVKQGHRGGVEIRFEVPARGD